jgi:hypothetical protein
MITADIQRLKIARQLRQQFLILLALQESLAGVVLFELWDRRLAMN